MTAPAARRSIAPQRVAGIMGETRALAGEASLAPVQAMLAYAAERWPALLPFLSRAFPWRWERPDEAGWDREYLAGDWERLRHLDEAARYHVIAALCRSVPRPRVLDLGCGEGLLAEVLRPEVLSDYLGVDISPAAVRNARRLEQPRVAFEAADLRRFSTRRTFDIVVWNEVLTYFDDPEAMIDRFAANLAPGGFVVVSLSSASFRARLFALSQWRRILQRGRVLEQFRLTARNGVVWDIGALRLEPA